MSPPRAWAPVVLAAALVLAAEGLWGQSLPAAVRVLVPVSTSAVPLLALAEEDPLAGTDIRAELFVNHPQALAALLRGDAELLLTGTSQGWENYLSGGPLVMVGTGVWGVSFLIGPPQGKPLAEWGELRGRRLALPFPGAPLDFQTRYLLVRAGLDPDRDLRLVYAPPPQAAALVAQGQVDAAALPEPLASRLVETQGLSRLLDYAEAWARVSDGDPRSPQVSLFCTQRFAANHPALLSALLEAWRRASETVSADPAPAAARFAGVLATEASVLHRGLANTLFYVPGPTENRERVVRYYRAVREYLPGERGELERVFFYPLP